MHKSNYEYIFAWLAINSRFGVLLDYYSPSQLQCAAVRILMFALAVLTVHACATAAKLKSVSIDLADGTVRGEITALGVERFLGIPFAQPPLGELRWQPPQRPQPWAGVREATKYSKSCMQSKNTFTAVSNVSEDCLYLVSDWLSF